MASYKGIDLVNIFFFTFPFKREEVFSNYWDGIFYLFKSSVHGYLAAASHTRCYYQGLTVAVIHNKCDCVYGGFISQNYISAERFTKDEMDFHFALNRKEYEGKNPIIIRDSALCVGL